MSSSGEEEWGRRRGLAARIWTPPDLSRDSSPSVLRVGCSRISGLSVEEVVLLAIMDNRAPRANRGAGVTRQGCYRPDAVSGRPKGHGFRHSLRTPGERVTVGYAASARVYATSFVQTAQTIRPNLLAIAIVALL